MLPANIRFDDDDDDDEPEKKEKLADHGEARDKTAAIEERLFKARTVLIYGGIDQKLAREVSARLLALQSASDDPITIYINSQGGHVESGDTIYDMVKFVKPEVRMVGTGWVASAGAHIFLGAKKENRLCLPNTRFLLHQPAGGMRGQASDIQIEAEQIIKMRDRVNRMIAKETGQTIERINKDTRRNFWMTAEEAKAYGLVSRIIDNTSEV